MLYNLCLIYYLLTISLLTDTGNMENTPILQTVVKHSSINVTDTISSLTSELKSQLKVEISLSDVPSYCKGLSVLAELVRYAEEQSKDSPEENQKELQSAVAVIVNEVCLPMVKQLHPSVDSRPDILVLLSKVGQALAECANFHLQCMISILNETGCYLDRFLKEKPTAFDLQNDTSLVDIHTVLDVLQQVLKRVARNSEVINQRDTVALFHNIFLKLLQSLDILSVELTGRLCIPVTLKIIKLESKQTESFLVAIWKTVIEFDQAGYKRKVFLLLCGFANYFFPTSCDIPQNDLRGDGYFWQILQSGLYSKDSVNRKRALYLLKRIVDTCESVQADVNTDGGCTVFWWSKARCEQLSKTWEDFMLLAEVLEEKQVIVLKHIILITAVDLVGSNIQNRYIVAMHFNKCISHNLIILFSCLSGIFIE